MDTYELLWKVWLGNVPKKYIAKELKKVGKPMEFYFAIQKKDTKNPEVVLMSKRYYEAIENDDDEGEESYDEDISFVKNLVLTCLGYKSSTLYDEATYPLKKQREILDFLSNLGISLTELEKINPYGDFDDDDDFF